MDESSPNTLVLPPPPNIASVTSLEHQVWKASGDVLVRVSFEVSFKFIILLTHISLYAAC